MFDKIRRTIGKIPRGKVATYGEVAQVAGFPGAARQVVWALHGASAMGLPWHRVREVRFYCAIIRRSNKE